MNKITTILIIGPDGNVGGVKTHVNHLKSILLKNNYKVKCTFGENILNMILLRFKFKPDVVIYNLSVYRNKIIRNFITRTIFSMPDCRHILHLHGGRFFDLNLSNFQLLKNSSFLHFNRFECIFCLTNEQQNYFFEDKRLQNKICKISNYVNIPSAAVIKKRNDFINLLYVGRLHRLKGVDLVIDAVRKINYQKIKLYIVGSGPLEEKISKINDKKIAYVGVQFGNDLAYYYRKSHIFLFPSSWPEGLPYVLLEAASYGLAIISTKVGATDEILNDGINGYFVENNNLFDLITKIEKLIKNHNLLQRMGNESSRICKEKFSIRQLDNLYQKLLCNKR